MDFLKKPPMSIYYPIERGSFDKLFEGLTDIFYLFKKEGLWENVLDIIELPNSVSNTFIKNMVNLICNGMCDEYFNYIIEFEHLNIINSLNALSQKDIAELVLVKQSIIYLRYGNAESFYNLANTVCSRDLSSKILDKLKLVFDTLD